MIDHITIATKDVEKSKAFYELAFQPLGYEVSFGEKNKFWAFQLDNNALFEIRAARADEQPVTSSHVAFRVVSKNYVDEFHKASLHAGGKDNGGPGLRPQYGDRYYACFVHDPDGHNIEAMLEVE
ncbi:glyoxalase/bleomycin resistance protein/dioxygenase superfamily protein [Rhodobiaceae bacterium]|nr:glyoxalase/bleomycin resistance protein/dioxygenase superfamily protein [Rhodobiaceae bacterium]